MYLPDTLIIMRTFKKIALGFFFFLFSIVFLLLTTLYFELLSSSFLFGSFERNNVYEKLPQALVASLPNDPNLSKEEQMGYSEIIAKIDPKQIKKIVEKNAESILNFIHGKSEDAGFYLPAKDLGIPDARENISWSISQNANPQLQERINLANGIGTKILILWFIFLLVLIGLFFLYGKLTSPKHMLGGSTLLILTGALILCLSTVLKFYLILISKELGKEPDIEPSQVLLSHLSSSLFTEIITTWIILGAILTIFGIFLTKLYSKSSL